MSDLEGKVVIVTGASSGIGEAIVVQLVDAGLRVAGLARRIGRVEKLAQSLEGKKGALSPVKCDVSVEDEVKNAFAWVEANLGPPTALINNAGVLKQGVLTGGKVDDMKQMFDTNVVGLAVCSREAIALMTKNNIPGTIININSTSGHCVIPVPGIAAYNASKYAVTALTEALRNELSLMKTNIRVTSLSPGLVESEMSDQLKGAFTPDQPILKAKDIADCVLFILKAPQYVNVSEMTVTHVNETSSTVSLSLASIMAKAGA
uniref:Dehydrogenase/reductase SDR family member 11 n=1 Tax=Lygus hesperus TaxID=30085 RepID=A0A0K8TFW7_LYGHE